jgi:serpin B
MVDAGALAPVVAGAIQFAINSFNMAAGDAGGVNLSYSPISMSLAFAMAYRGAGGNTATQIAQVLQYPDQSADLAPLMGALACELIADAAAPDGGLVIANAFFGQTGHTFGADFVSALSDQFGAPLQYLDFDADLEAARRTLNAWVDARTQCKIPELIPAGDMPPNSKWALINALYFHGLWSNPFDANHTFTSTFHPSGQSQVQVPMMSQQEMFPYGEGNGYQLLEMPVAGAQVAVDILLPSQVDGLEALRQSLTPDMLSGALAGMQRTLVAVDVPKFALDTPYDMIPILKALGLQTPFDYVSADFTPLYVDDGTYILLVRHESTLNFEEGGLSATAATVIVGGTTGGTTGGPQPTSFIADHPFLLFVRDVPTGAVLFMAQVIDPTQS